MPIRVLHVEDQAADAELVAAALTAEGLDCSLERVADEVSLRRRLQDGPWDVVLSDNSLPGFEGRRALEVVRELAPSLPFVFVSGTLGEDRAVEMVKAGATDYVLKDRLWRLGPCVRRALAEKEDHDARLIAERKLREKAALLDRARDAIFVRDLDGRITFWNASAERIYGWKAHEALGCVAGELLACSVPTTLEEARNGVLERGEWSGELVRRARSARDVVVESRWSLLRDAAGSPESILVIDTDVTEERSLRNQFLRAQRLESLGVLAGGIAHDLNNVLAPIVMAAEMLSRRLDGERELRLVANIEEAGRRGADLVRQILAFARGGSYGDRRVIEPGDLLTEIVRLLSQTLPRSIEIRTDVAEGLEPIEADVTQVHQVLVNLCVNARDAMPDGGTLQISVAPEDVGPELASRHPGVVPGPHVRFRVEDTGSGMPQDVLDHIFDPFFTTKPSDRGTGLGLSTSAAIVAAHHGFIAVESRLGRGTRFDVVLPSSERSTERERAPSDLAALPGGHGELVLVVDDEPAIRELTRETLESFGYRTLTARDGQEALELFVARGHAIDAVVTDSRMPRVDGATLFRELRQRFPELPVVTVSGLGEAPGDGGHADPWSAALPKPVQPEDLVYALRALLRRRGPAAS